MSLLQKSALWGAQNRLRMVRDRVASLAPFTLLQEGTGGDELTDPLTVLGDRPFEDGETTSSTNLSSIRKSPSGKWYFVLEPFVIPPLILPGLPAGWNGTLAQGFEQELPIDGATGHALTLWLRVEGAIYRVQTSPGFWENKSGEYQLSSANLRWEISSFTPPDQPPIPGPSEAMVRFDWWVQIFIPNTAVAPDHEDFNKPVGYYRTNNEFYPPYLSL